MTDEERPPASNAASILVFIAALIVITVAVNIIQNLM